MSVIGRPCCPVCRCAQLGALRHTRSGVSYGWHGGKLWVAWDQPLEIRSLLDLDENCSHPVRGCLHPTTGVRRGPRWRFIGSGWTKP